MLDLRCSRLPLTVLCPASTVPPAMRIETDDEAARLGTAVHLVLAATIQGGSPDVHAVAGEQRVDHDETDMLAAMGWRLWQQVAKHFPAPAVEMALEATDHGAGVRLTGHADVFSPLEDEVRIADWKTGFLDADHEQQLRGYAWLGLLRHPEAKGAYACVLRVRDGEIDGYYWLREELAEWWADVTARLADRESFHPGGHCRFCPRGHECPAKERLLMQAARSVGIIGDVPGVLPAGPERAWVMAGLLEQARLLESHIATAKELIRAEVALAGGRLDLGDGRELRLNPQKQRKIDPAAGWDAIAEQLDHEEMMQVITIGKGKLAKLVRSSAGHGQGAKAMWALNKRLEEDEAFREQIVERLEIRKISQQIGRAT